MKRIILFVCFGSILTCNIDAQALSHSAFFLQNSPAGHTDDKDTAMDQVLKLIDNSPAWSNVENDDSATRQDILWYCKEIAQFDLVVIRKAFRACLKNHPIDAEDHTEHMSRLFVINRYLFNVPTYTPSDKIIRFGGWSGTPSIEFRHNWLWPLSTDNDGNLLLTGTLVMYAGAPYRAIEEFDFFEKTFGPRKLTREK